MTVLQPLELKAIVESLEYVEQAGFGKVTLEIANHRLVNIKQEVSKNIKEAIEAVNTR